MKSKNLLLTPTFAALVAGNVLALCFLVLLGIPTVGVLSLSVVFGLLSWVVYIETRNHRQTVKDLRKALQKVV